MPRPLRLLLIIGGGLLVIAVMVLVGLYWASHYEPAFYREALAVDAAEQEKASNLMVRRVISFQNKLKREGTWEATFTAQEINSWLAFDLQRNHPEAIPPGFRDPCVAIDPSAMQLACRYESGMTSSVLCLVVEPYVPEPNVLALRIVKARAGMLPLPLTDVLNGISEAVRNSSCSIDWKQVDGNPVALITFPSLGEKGDMMMKIKTIKLREGEIYISGSTQRNK